ncbi:hypothetical protein [Eubacterium sp. 1001713B170207_170306_E7]|uniref:hypothetical protein n=1 Tax=Eubacterium sp. 1001713B170207_170306_E7 TaxID=2787097 RepID=UPI0018984EED|nr:hypothetical protein [Eubacterium sp. 1001713B170207_170306_E7]
MSSNDVLAVIVPLITGGIIALAIFLAAGVYLFRRTSEKIRQEASDKGITVKMYCEDCRSTFEMPASVVLSSRFSRAPRKQLLVKKPFVSTKGIPMAGSVERAVKYKHYYKCPVCHLRAWLKIVDPDEYYNQLQPIFIKKNLMMFWLVPIGFGCLIVLGLVYKLVSLFF